MNDIKSKQEAIVISEYCDVITQIMDRTRELSLIKLYTFAFLYKKIDFNDCSIYSGLDRVNVVYKCLSCMSGSFNEYCAHIKYIISALDILITNNKFTIDGNYVENKGILKARKFSSKYSNIYKAIDESKFFSDRQFLKEVMRNV